MYKDCYNGWSNLFYSSSEKLKEFSLKLSLGKLKEKRDVNTQKNKSLGKKSTCHKNPKTRSQNEEGLPEISNFKIISSIYKFDSLIVKPRNLFVVNQIFILVEIKVSVNRRMKVLPSTLFSSGLVEQSKISMTVLFNLNSVNLSLPNSGTFSVELLPYRRRYYTVKFRIDLNTLY